MNQAKHHLFLSINTSSVGQAGCVVSVTGKHTWNEFVKEGTEGKCMAGSDIRNTF